MKLKKKKGCSEKHIMRRGQTIGSSRGEICTAYIAPPFPFDRRFYWNNANLSRPYITANSKCPMMSHPSHDKALFRVSIMNMFGGLQIANQRALKRGARVQHEQQPAIVQCNTASSSKRYPQQDLRGECRKTLSLNRIQLMGARRGGHGLRADDYIRKLSKDLDHRFRIAFWILN